MEVSAVGQVMLILVVIALIFGYCTDFEVTVITVLILFWNSTLTVTILVYNDEVITTETETDTKSAVAHV